MTYAKLTDPPQKVRMAAMRGGTCPRFPGPGKSMGGYEVNAVIDASVVAETARVRQGLCLRSWNGSRSQIRAEATSAVPW
jgi:hypothetical protein